MNLEIRHLKQFNADLNRDILSDARRSPVRVPDQSLLMRVVEYGNRYLETHKKTAEDDNAVIWFDVHFGEPAQVGMTYAYHPLAPLDDLYGEPHFWRMWSEIANIADGKTIYTLEQCQRDFAAYTMQAITG